ncbi:MAG: APC family permease [Gammaproteobacteria bacterium]|nr:APC family permease [Gammaproteobacteria bacterium]
MSGAAQGERGGLRRVLGRAFAASAAIGTTIGGGILYTPGKIAALLPNPAWILGIWAFGGLNSLLGATVFAELGAMIPQSGGPYPFARRGLGEYAAFLVGYTQWVLDCAANAALLLLVGEYLLVLLPELPTSAEALAFAALALLTALNWRGVRGGGRIQVATTIAKTLALGAVAVAAFVLPHGHSAGPAAPAAPHGVGWVVPVILAMQGVIFTYDSYYAPIFFGEEVRDPGREIPRAIFRGLAVIIPIYLLLNAAFLVVLPLGRMANESFVGGAAAQALFGAHGDQIIRVIVVVSVLGTSNALILVTARVLLAMGRDGLFARQATRINAGGTPSVALLLSTLVAAGFLASGTFNAVLAVVSLLMAANYLFVYFSMVALRRCEPQTPRPYRAWGYPYTTAAAIVIGVVFVFGVALSDPRHAAIAFALLIASYPLYLGTRRLFRGAGVPV